MISDFLNVIKEWMRVLGGKVRTSRLFLLGAAYAALIAVMVVRLYRLQIIQGESFLKDYIQKTEKNVSIQATRGNIFDVNGKLLAYNRLAYAVTIQDNGDYKKAADRNLMYYRLIQILNRHGETVTGRLEIALDENGEYCFTAESREAKHRFLRDLYGLRRVEDLTDENGKYPADISAEDLIQNRAKYYGLNKLRDADGNAITLTPMEQLELINIRYTMGLTAYQRYEKTIVANDVKEPTRAEILENRALLLGVDCVQTTERVYNDAIPFSSIIGYVGRVQEDQLETLKSTHDDYSPNDTVGRTGIEEYMEQELHGIKGSRVIYVDNVGHIMEVKSETPPVAGNDVYLSIDRDLQVGIYHLLEKHLAGVLASKLVNQDDPNTERTDSTARLIPIKDAYYQLIGNNILSIRHMQSGAATENEKRIAEKLAAYTASSEENMRAELMNPDAKNISELPDDQRAFMYFLYNLLASDEVGILRKDEIPVTESYYTRWKADSISLRELLYSGIRDGWVDASKLDTGKKYAGEDELYVQLVTDAMEQLKESPSFGKLICQYMIRGNIVGGKELCLALYDQGILEHDAEEERMLATSGEEYAYRFFVRQVSEIKLTPAQLALDPCTAGCVVTDIHTGKVRALVSYPGYDNNRLTNTMDVAYYNRLLADQSLPLYNNATQARKAPGSTFKPITALAGLEEHVIGINDTVNCTGLYDAITPPMRCWIYPGSHGEETMVTGIRNSCNFFFAEIAHRLATDAKGEYDPKLGMERIRKYAEMFGLGKKSGIELMENEPMISDASPEQSAIGQGTHSFANVQLSRYVTTLANRGTVFDLSILDRVTNWEGTPIRSYEPKVDATIHIQKENWDTVQRGMREVVEFGSPSKLFKDLEVNIAGKTGTAQESKSRANHAFFISFGPYENPQVAVTVNIPYGYTSTNAASISKDVYRLCFGYTSLDYILKTGAQRASNVNIID